METLIEIDVSSPYFEFLLSGEKKVEGKKNSPKWGYLQKGMRIKFVHTEDPKEFFWARIAEIRTYSPGTGVLNQFLQNEGVNNLLPGKRTLEEGRKVYLSFRDQGQTEQELETIINKYGMLAIQIERI